MNTPSDLEWTPAQRRLLQGQDFEQRPPGTVLRDVEALLGLLKDEGLPVTPAHRFAKSCLETINQALTHPLELFLQRPMQKSYPHINGLYLLLRSTGLVRIDTQIKPPRLKADPQVLARWKSLNPAEHYFALLGAWWGRAREEIIGEHGFWPGIAAKIVMFLDRIPQSGVLTLSTPQEADTLRYYPGLYNLALLELFGLVTIRTRPPVAGQGWQPEQIQLTQWGAVLLKGYAAFLRRTAEDGLISLDPGLGAPLDPLDRFAQWSQILRPHIPAWRRDMELPEPPFQPGVHRFKVSLETTCWRRIASPGEASLDELAATILDAFDFDSDHLYRFSYQDRFGRTIGIDHPYLAGETDAALADEIRVGDLPVYPGMHIEFLFDFGDQWEFALQVEAVEAEATIIKPQIVESHGRAPAQYGEDDE